MMTVWLVILTIVGKLTALGKDIVFAGSFGAGPSADAYYIANQLPGLIWLAVSGTIVPVFAPLYVQRLGQAGAASSFANQAVRYYVYAGIILTTVCLLAADALVWMVAPALDPATHDLAVDLTRIMALGFVLTAYVGVQSAIQQANSRFIAPMAVPVINNLVTIAAIMLAWYWNNVAIAVAGAVGAYLIQAIIQRLQTMRYYVAELRFGIPADVVKRLSLLSAPVGLALLLDQLHLLVANALASGFGTGAIAQFNYANRLALFVAGVFSWLVSYVFFPALAANAAKHDDTANAALLTRALAIILIATAPVAAGTLVMREEVVALIYQRGAFGGADVTATASLFGLLTVGIIFVAMRELLNRVFFSYQRTAAPLLVGAVAIAANVALSLWLVQRIGLPGVALGNALAAVVYFAGQLALLWRWKPGLLQPRLLAYGGAVGLAVLTAYFVTDYLADYAMGEWPVMVRLLIGGAALMVSYVPVLLLALALLGVPMREALSELTGKALPGKRAGG